MVKTEDIVNDAVVKIGDIVQLVDDGELNVTIVDAVHGEAPAMPLPSLDTVVPVTCEGDLVTFEWRPVTCCPGSAASRFAHIADRRSYSHVQPDAGGDVAHEIRRYPARRVGVDVLAAHRTNL